MPLQFSRCRDEIDRGFVRRLPISRSDRPNRRGEPKATSNHQTHRQRDRDHPQDPAAGEEPRTLLLKQKANPGQPSGYQRAAHRQSEEAIQEKPARISVPGEGPRSRGNILRVAEESMSRRD